MSDPIIITDPSQKPFNKICHFRIHRKRFGKKNKWFDSTGFFIARNFILTAAHNIHSQPFTNVDFIKINIGQYNDNQLFTAIRIKGLERCKKHCFTPAGYSLTQRWYRRILNDYGLIHVPDSLLPEGFEWEDEFKIYSGLIDDIQAKMAGYPANSKAGFNGEEMYFQEGEITIKSSKVYEHSFDTQGGNSGSPVWNDEKGVVGIHTFEASGTILDADAIENIKNWMK